MNFRILGICLLALAAPSTTFADDFTTTLAKIQTDWAVANYAIKDSDLQANAVAALSERTRAFVTANPNRAEALIWDGIVESTWAGASGGLSALRHAKQARRQFEAALKIDASALDGSAYTSLGTLYHKVPGFPIGFGSKKKARQYLQKALELNPEGIDANFFYAEYLLDQGESAAAREHLQRGLRASDRPGRQLADEGRRAEIRSLLDNMGTKTKAGA